MMVLFDQSAEQPPAESVMAAKAARDSPSQQQALKLMAERPQNEHEELTAMLLELQTNRGILEGMSSWYGLFVFTGGDVPTAQWNLAAMTSHLVHPLATDCPVMPEIQHYQRLIQTLGSLGQPGVGPRTLRCRYEMGDQFRAAASEIRFLTDALESSVMQALEELASRPE